jgi:antitoxin component HigA of HigAB toxin-antitoxin module
MSDEQMDKMISPIRDDAGHQAALAEIERLWSAEAGSRAGGRLDVLMTLGDAYERARWPDENLDPIDAITARMKNSGRTHAKGFRADRRIFGSSLRNPQPQVSSHTADDLEVGARLEDVGRGAGAALQDQAKGSCCLRMN